MPPLSRIIALCVTLAAACGGGGGTSTAGTSNPTSPTTPTPPVLTGCEISAQADAGPLLSDPKSPYFDNLGIAQSANGSTATQFVEVLAHASAPDATRMPDGSIGVYYHNGETGGAVWLGRVMGSTIVPVAPISIDGLVRPKWVADPNADLVDGKVRLTYLHGEDASRRKFCIAESTDGVAFTTRVKAVDMTSHEADPSLVRLQDGTWLMAYSRENHTGVGFARSNDGLSFTAFATASYGPVPELAVLSDGRVRLYVCAGGGVDAYLSSDRGTTWTREGQVIGAGVTGRAIVCDPSYLPADGLFILKTTDAR